MTASMRRMAAVTEGMSLRVLIAERCVVGPWWHYERVVSPFCRLYLVHEGAAELTLGGRRVALRPGLLAWIPAFAPCDYGCARRMDHTYVHLCATLAHGVDLGRAFAMPPTAPATSEHARLLGELLRRRARGGPADEVAADACLRLVLADLLAAATPSREPGADRFASVLRAIDDRLEERLDVRGLAALAGLHPTWFSNVFARRFGMGPAAWVAARRLERAAMLLRTTAMPIEAIAARCGFAERGYFSRCFARRFGCGPATWRKRAGPGE